MGSKVVPIFFICMLFMSMSLPPVYACGGCCPNPPNPPHHCPSPPSTPRPHPPTTPRPHPPSAPGPHPPHHGGPPKVSPPPSRNPPGTLPPVIPSPPVTTPPILNPPGILPPIINPPGGSPPYPPYRGPPGGPPGGGGGGGGGPGISPPPPPTEPKCPINALKLGLCVDVLGGLVHIGIGDPIENVCCPVLKGLLELEAAICLCTILRIKLLNLNIFLPLALQVLATCGVTPPPGFVCPPLA